MTFNTVDNKFACMACAPSARWYNHRNFKNFFCCFFPQGNIQIKVVDLT